ncbi:kinase-like domain-containing protein [Lasiosphaeria ovina]|uniref:non-specific serine/threonine protein kinase n=1 Tax=Lasiosphaeria ovina TaxID=92902 RepID=A0AAE0NJR7_9PEZI|nr:kinase-like domain-containing protein [Lasiosphaeria ovina]
MPPTDVIHEFKDYVENYITDHGCHGQDLWGPRDFVPRVALADFWDRDKVIDVLCSGGTYRADITKILDDHLVGFSILVWISRPRSINLFMSVGGGLDDAKLPRSGTPTEWEDVPENKDILDEFCKAQWKFCPLTLDHRLRLSNLDSFHIIPITSKELLDPQADEEEAVVVYKATWHSSCLGLLASPRVILKVYHHRNKEVSAMLCNEVDVYSLLEPNAFKHIIGYFGSFEQKGMSTIVLEYASGGNLLEYLEKTVPPHRPDERYALWDSFFQLLLGLHATHNLNPTAENVNELGQIHQDIRPQNILIAGTETNPYRVRFKLADFGAAHVRSCRKQGLDTMGAQRKVNGMFSAPESRRDDNLTKPQLCECDIWSLGAVASELLVWSLKGDDMRQEYQAMRRDATRKTRLDGGYHEGCFHDGDCRLRVVDEWHKSLLASEEEDDIISPLVSNIILEHMLVANPGDRSNATKVYQAWSNESGSARLLEGRRISYPSQLPPVPRGKSFNSMMSAQASEARSLRRQVGVEPWLPRPMSSEPTAISTTTPMQRRSMNSADLNTSNLSTEHMRRDPQWHYRQSGNWAEIDNPGLSSGRHRLKGSEGRDQVFVVDDSISMTVHQDQMGKTVRVLTRILKSGDVDPDKIINLYYTSSRKPVSKSRATQLQDDIGNHEFSGKPCDIFESLDSIKTDHDRSKPLSIYILTNGRWNAAKDNPTDVCKLDSIIKQILRRNYDAARISNHVGIQFIRFYGSGQEDAVGKERLQFLDDRLEEQFEGLGIPRTDIVDTTDWDGDVCKMLLGGVFRDADNLASPDQV